MRHLEQAGSNLDYEGLPQLSTLLFGCRFTSAMSTYLSPDPVAAMTASGRLREFGAVNSGRWLSRAVRAQRRCRPGLRYRCQQCIRQRPFVPATVARADDRLAALSVNSPAGDERQQPLQSGHSRRRDDGQQRVGTASSPCSDAAVRPLRSFGEGLNNVRTRMRSAVSKRTELQEG